MSAFFCLEKKVIWLSLPDNEVIVDEDATDAQAESYITLGNILLMLLIMEVEEEVVPRILSACSAIGLTSFSYSAAEQDTGVKGFIPIKTIDEHRRADLKKARDELGFVIRKKEAALD